MRRQILLFVLFIIGYSVDAKTTYIPKYRTYIHIVNGSDTIVSSINLNDLELKDNGGMFSIIVEHEDVDKEKVKAIKRAKRAAGWATFSAVMSGVSTVFSQNSLQYMVRSTNTRIAGQLADIYNENANAEETLLIDTWIVNTSGEEIMINDMERGLTWYVRPSQLFHLQLNNPDVANLRISDVRHNQVRYAMIAAGSRATKSTIEWEDNDYWITVIMKDNGSSIEFPTIDKYLRISKSDYTETEMSIEEFREFKKRAKNK